MDSNTTTGQGFDPQSNQPFPPPPPMSFGGDNSGSTGQTGQSGTGFTPAPPVPPVQQPVQAPVFEPAPVTPPAQDFSQPQAPAPQPPVQQPQYTQPAMPQPTFDQPMAPQQPQYTQPTMPQPTFDQPMAPQQPQYSQPAMPQPTFDQPMQQPQYGMPQPPVQQPQYGQQMPIQPQYGQPMQQPQYGMPQPPVQQPQYGQQMPMQPQYGQPMQQPQYGMPQPPMGGGFDPSQAGGAMGGANPPADEEDKTPANFQIGKDLPAQLAVPVPEHSLNFDGVYFLRLLASSISLSKAEKKRIIDSIPKLKQSQIDELINIFEDEKAKFAELPKKHTAELERLAKSHLEDWLDIEAEYKAVGQKEEEDRKAEEIRKQLGL